MSLFYSKRIGITIQNNIIFVCETKTGTYNKSTEINAVSATDIPEEIYSQGKIIDEAALIDLIQNTLSKAKPHPIRSSEVVFEIPEEHTFHHILELPKSIPEQQIMEASVLEVEKVLPYSIDQVTWDIKVIEQVGKNNLILFSAVPIEVAQDLYDILNSASLQPLGFSVRPDGIINTIGSKNLPATILIDLQNTYTSVYLMINDKMIDMQQINVGENDLKKTIRDQFELDEKKLDKQIAKLSQIDINLATIHVMNKFSEELNNLVEVFDKKMNDINKINLKNQELLKQKEKIKNGDKDSKDNKNKKGDKDKDKKEKESKDKKAKEAKKAAAGKNKKVALQKNFHSKKIAVKHKEGTFNFLFTGNSVFLYAIKEFFKHNKNKKLSPLEGDLKKIMNIKAKDYSLLHFFHLKDKKTKTKTTKKGAGLKKKGKKKIVIERTIIQKLIPSAVGAALADFTKEESRLEVINLLPINVRTIALWKKNIPWFHILAVCILIFSIGWLSALGNSYGTTYNELKIAKQNFKQVEQEFAEQKSLTIEQRIKSANQEIAQLSQLKPASIFHSSVLDRVKDVLPESIVIEVFQYGLLTDKGMFELKGRAPDRATVIDVYNQVNDLDFVQRTLFPASNFNSRTGEVKFTLRFILKP